VAIIYFLLNLVQKCRNDLIMERAAELTYRVLLAFFPFLIFLLSLAGFMQLDEAEIMVHVPDIFPPDVADLILSFVGDLSLTQSGALLSTGLFFAVYNTTNGFRAVIRCINHAYEMEETRNIVWRVVLSFGLMLLFTMSILFMVGALVFGSEIWDWLVPNAPGFLFMALRVVGALIVLMGITSFIYKISCAKKIRFRDVLPGAAVAVTGWVVASSVFGFFISNFTRLGVIYGSIAGVFILILWLNLICVILLVGNQINASLDAVRSGDNGTRAVRIGCVKGT